MDINGITEDDITEYSPYSPYSPRDYTPSSSLIPLTPAWIRTNVGTPPRRNNPNSHPINSYPLNNRNRNNNNNNNLDFLEMELTHYSFPSFSSSSLDSIEDRISQTNTEENEINFFIPDNHEDDSTLVEGSTPSLNFTESTHSDSTLNNSEQPYNNRFHRAIKSTKNAIKNTTQKLKGCFGACKFH